MKKPNTGPTDGGRATGMTLFISEGCGFEFPSLLFKPPIGSPLLGRTPVLKIRSQLLP